MQLQIAVATWRVETRNDCAFSEITLVFVIVAAAAAADVAVATM